jgi:hypothetical protein
MAGMARDIALMVRRQYADIDRDLAGVYGAKGP